MRAANHDTLVRRLAMILVKLNQGERLDPAALADEFSVNLRTIQRDLNERFAYLPLEKVDGHYQLNPVFLGKLSTRDIERFASLAGVRGLFPSISDDFLRDIFDGRIQSALLVKGHHYEDIADKAILEYRFEMLVEHAGCYEIVFVLSDDGYGAEVFVIKHPDIDPQLLAMCAAHAQAESMP